MTHGVQRADQAGAIEHLHQLRHACARAIAALAGFEVVPDGAVVVDADMAGAVMIGAVIVDAVMVGAMVIGTVFGAVMLGAVLAP